MQGLYYVVRCGTCPNLVRVVLYEAELTDQGLEFLASMATLKVLALTWCLRITVVGIGHLAAGQLRLETLKLKCCGCLADWVAADRAGGLSRCVALYCVDIVETEARS